LLGVPSFVGDANDHVDFSPVKATDVTFTSPTKDGTPSKDLATLDVHRGDSPTKLLLRAHAKKTSPDSAARQHTASWFGGFIRNAANANDVEGAARRNRNRSRSRPSPSPSPSPSPEVSGASSIDTLPGGDDFMRRANAREGMMGGLATPQSKAPPR
jgi:hypothetical protein